MSSKYDTILNQLKTKFYTDDSVDEDVRRIVHGVLNIEMEHLSQQQPHVMKDIKELIEKEAKEKLKDTEE